MMVHAHPFGLGVACLDQPCVCLDMVSGCFDLGFDCRELIFDCLASVFDCLDELGDRSAVAIDCLVRFFCGCRYVVRLFGPAW